MKKQPKFSPEVIERAVRMLSEAGSQYESQWAAITSIAAKIGCRLASAFFAQAELGRHFKP